MKKKVLSVVLAMAMVMSAAGCNGGTETSESTDSTELTTTTSATKEDYVSEKATTATNTDTEKTIMQEMPEITIDGWNTVPPWELDTLNTPPGNAFNAEIVSEPFEIPAEFLAAYSDGEYYTNNYAIVETKKLTVCIDGKIREYDFSGCTYSYADSDYGRILNSSEEFIGSFNRDIYEIDDEIVLSDKLIRVGDVVLNKRVDIINNMPTVYYESLDNQGEFGVMNVPDEIKSVIDSEAGDDYIISNNSDEGYYLLSCFDENEILYKQIKFTNNGNGYTREDIDFQDPYEHYYGVYIEQTGEKCQIASKLACISSMALSKFEETVIGGYTASPSMVYGEHCFKSRVKDNVIFYMSKPISITEGERFNELNPLIEGIFDFINVQINERGKEQYPDVALIIIADDMGDMKPNALASQISCEVRMDENTWYSIGNDGYPCSNAMEIFSNGNTLAISTDKPIKYVNNRWHLIDGFSVVEATVNGDKLTVTFKYYSDDNVNSENYKNYTPDETVTSEYTR